MKFIKKIQQNIFQRKTKTSKLPTVFLEKKKQTTSIKHQQRLKKISKRSFLKNAPINLIGKLSLVSKWMWITVILGLFIGIFYLVFFTNIFNIQKVLIYEAEQESTNLQIRRITEPLRNSNLFLFSKAELQESIKKRVENLTNLEISRQIPNTVIIRYTKYKETANVANLIGPAQVKKSFILNEIGYLVEQDKISTSLPTIFIRSNKAYEIGQKIIQRDELKYILEAKQHFEEKFDLKVTEIRYIPQAKEVRLFTERNFEIWLDILIPYTEQLNKLKNAIPKINVYEGQLEYVDLRIQSAEGQKIIYK